MDVPATEEQIRALAYRLWEEAGSPEGRADEFWAQARQQLGTDIEPTQDAESRSADR